MSGNASNSAESSFTPSDGMSHNPDVDNPNPNATAIEPTGDRGSSGNDRAVSPPHHEDNTQGSGLDPASLAVLTACSKFVDNYRSQKITKASALLGIQSILAQAIPDKEGLDEAFSRYLTIIENHEQILHRAAKRGRPDDTPNPAQDGDIEFSDEQPMEDEAQVKRTKPDESDFPWNVSDLIHSVTLSPSLTRTLELLKLYAVDLKRTKRSLINSPTCPEFPDSEWTNIIAGRAVNLDNVLSGYYSTSNNDERTETVGEVEIKFGTISPSKVVSTSGDWSISWNRTARATTMAFPHRAGELANYSEYIIALFGATDIRFHDRVISYDRALRRRLGSRRDLELTDINKFSDLKQTHMESIGAAVIQQSTITTKSAGAHKKNEACNRWNDGLCTLDNAICRRLHICNKCSKPGHKSPDCPSL